MSYGKHKSVLTDLVSHKKINNSFNINPNTIIIDSKLKPCVLNFIIFIFCSRFHTYKLLWIFNHYKHRHCPFDKFVGFFYKFSKGIQITIFSSEILKTYTRHIINQSSTNHFPNYFLQKSQNFIQLSAHCRKRKQSSFHGHTYTHESRRISNP